MKKFLIISIILILIMLPITFASAEYKLEIGLPGQEGATEGEEVGLEDYIRYIYLFALGIIGLAAFGVMIYGGFLYMASGTNIVSQEEAKKWMYGAIFGLILGLASYLILNTINPDLVRIRAPEPPEIETTNIWESLPSRPSCSVDNCPAECETTCPPNTKWYFDYCMCLYDEQLTPIQQQQQASGKYQWKKIDYCSNLDPPKSDYRDSSCPPPKPGPEYNCCGKF